MRQSRRGSMANGRSRSQRPPHRSIGGSTRPRRGGFGKALRGKHHEKEHRYSSSASSYKGSSDCGYQSSNQSKPTSHHLTTHNDTNQMTDDTG